MNLTMKLILNLILISFCTQALAGEFNTLTCDTLHGEIHLDLRDKSASINVYCHAIGCSGTGEIESYDDGQFIDMFLLKMDMGLSSLQYLIMNVKYDGSGFIHNHPRASTLFNCVRE